MKRLWIAMFVLATSLSSHAAEFQQLQPAGSSIGFVSKQMGVPVTGRFGKFTAQINFDPDHLAASKARIEIDMASIDAGNSDANDEVKGKDWFDIRQYPAARFVSTGIKSVGGGRYEATGKMTIKAVTRNVTIPFTANMENSMATLDGGLTISRLQYGVGAGEWADPDTVADEVQLRFKLQLSAVRK